MTGTSDALRLQRGAEHVHRLGARAVAELVAQVARERRDLPATLKLLDDWREGLSAELLHAAGGDSFPRRLILEVPA
jgi:hypothetical protein